MTAWLVVGFEAAILAGIICYLWGFNHGKVAGKHLAIRDEGYAPSSDYRESLRTRDSEIARLYDEVNYLRGFRRFANHDHDCETRRPIAIGEVQPECNCGLYDAMTAEMLYETRRKQDALAAHAQGNMLMGAYGSKGKEIS